MKTCFVASQFVFICSILASNLLVSQISFKESSSSLGVNHNMRGHTIGAGISIYDFNQDGYDDLTMATYKGTSVGFYINTGHSFEKIPPLVNNTQDVKQINWVDYDNDGDPDLYLAANNGINHLYQNQGNLIFEEVTESASLPLNTHYGYGASWGDYNRDGWIDLYYASKGIIGAPDAIRSYNRLFLNRADGTFLEQTEQANAADDGKLPFCAAFIDYNKDMWPDIYIANDKLTYNTLLENDKNGGFVDVSYETGADVRMNAMCVSPGDIDRDGWIDIYITNTPVGSKCLRNSGQLNEEGYFTYKDIGHDQQIDFVDGNGWGSNFFDADNDGDLDLYVSSSLTTPQSVSSAFYESIEATHFIRPEIAGFAGDTVSSYSNAVGDLNNDGLMDIVVHNAPPFNFFIWENQTANENHWVKINLEGVLSNRDAIGSRIECYSKGQFQMHWTTCGSGFLSQKSSYWHFGLGKEETVDSVLVYWPSGHVDKFDNLPTDRIVHLKEGASTDGVIEVAADVTIKDKSEFTTATNEISESSLNLFPNPAQGVLNLTSEERLSYLSVYNSVGICVLRQNDINTSHLKMDISTLKEGPYYIVCGTKNKQERVISWIKLKE